MTRPVLMQKKPLWLLAVVFPLICFLILFSDYLITNTFFWICIITLPLSIIRSETNRFPFFALSIAIALLGLILPTKIGIYVFACSMTLFMAQYMLGGLHINGLIHIFLASPFFTYFSKLISFPIRIQLSKAVAHLLELTGFESDVSGNVILLDGQEFLVDQVCSGMYLFSYSILFGTIILSLSIRKKSMSGWSLMGYYAFLSLLILVGNIVRIYVLVVTRIEAGNWMHETVGLFLFIFQILIPFYLLVNRKAITPTLPKFESASLLAFPVGKCLLLAVLFGLMIYTNSGRDKTVLNESLVSLSGFKLQPFSDDVIKLYNQEALIYIKKPVSAHSADHNPTICWQGSGYSFQQVDQITCNGKVVNFATLKKGSDLLYTSWWFESKQSKTPSQWDWRWKSLRHGEQFYLVNVTCETKDQLISNINFCLADDLIKN